MPPETETSTPPNRGRGRGRPRGEPPAAEPNNAAVEAQLETLGVTASTQPSDPDDLMAPPPAEAETEAPASSVVVETENENETPEERQQASDDALSPFRREPLPPPRETKTQERRERTEKAQAKNMQTPSKKRFGILGEKIPGAEHIKIHKRMDNGDLSYVGEYDANALSQSQDIEGFCNRYIKPSYGPGEYQITGVDAAGRSFDGGKVTLINPLSTPDLPPATVSAANPLALVQQMLERDATRRDQEIRALMSDRKDPIQMLKEMHELQRDMAPPMPQLKPSEGNSNRGNDATATMMAGMFQMMGTVLSVALQPKSPDPIMMALLNSLINNRPEAVDPTKQLQTLSEVVKNLGGGGGGGKDDRFVELLLAERMKPSDVLGLIEKVKAERGTDGLKKSMEDIGIMLGAVNQLRAHTEPGTASGFWEAVTAVLGNPALASAIGSRVKQVTQPQQQGSAHMALPAQQQTRALPPPSTDPVVLKARELAMRKMRIEELEIEKREKALGLTPPQQQQAAQPAQAAQTAPAEAQEPQAAETAPEQPAAPTEPVNTLPPNIAEHINAYLQAKDEGDIVQTTIEMIFSLAEDEKWKPYSEVIVGFILQSDRAKFMQYMASFVVSLRTMGLLEDSLARKIVETLHNNFDTVVKTVQEQLAAQGDNDEGEDADGEEEEEEEDVLGLNQNPE